ncbi:MAG: hypothetical protein LBK62_04405 [Treponema sp.]|jgi:hypothetical protein|nr:hypothetical protein [Treponema sp.]
MKYCVLGALLLFGAFSFAETMPEGTASTETAPAGTAEDKPLLDWKLLWAGVWDEGKTLGNRGELRLDFPLPGLSLRGLALDKRPFNFEQDPPWGDPADGVSNFGGGMYHKPTGSRLLYGVLDEWGLSARIRSPWSRSAPYVENHKPLMADLRTSVSASKEPEAYLYLSSPRLSLFPGTRLRGFAAAQTGTETGFRPDFSGGLETQFAEKVSVLLEGFYTGAELPARKSDSWFSDPPPLPDREFHLYALGLLVNTPLLSLSSDWAYSETFAWGRDIYGSLGIRVNPPLPGTRGKTSNGKTRAGPLAISLAADGGGERFTGRDGSSPGAGFRTAGKIEWKGKRSSLFRLNTSLRGPGLGKPFNRSSSGISYRFPAPVNRAGGKNAGGAQPFPLRVSRISLSASRNAADTRKITDGIDGTLGLSLNIPPVPVPGLSRRTAGGAVVGSPLGVNLSGSLKGHSSLEETPSPYPAPQSPWDFDSAKAGCELSWSPGVFQFKTKVGYTAAADKEGQWDTAFSAGVRFKPGRLSVKAASEDFPHKWNCTISWRLEKK